MGYVKGLKCKECKREFPKEPIHVCEFCFGPLEVDYDYEKIGKQITRESIKSGPPSMWRYKELMPLDEELIYGSVQKTGRAILLQEDCLFGGIASDISAMINEHCFSYLDAPVKRVGSMNTPVPFARELEENFLPKKRFAEAVEEILAY